MRFPSFTTNKGGIEVQLSALLIDASMMQQFSQFSLLLQLLALLNLPAGDQCQHARKASSVTCAYWRCVLCGFGAAGG